MIVERERERMAFVAANYSSVVATCEFDSIAFDAKLLSIDGKRIAVSKSFDEKGKLTADVVVLDTEAAEKIASDVNGKTLKVVSVESKPNSRKPYAPFTTSTLQQEASRKLGLSAKMTMDIAQQLYQGGYITYMRTDSPNLSQQAIAAARKQATELFGKELVADEREFMPQNQKMRRKLTKQFAQLVMFSKLQPSWHLFCLENLTLCMI